MCVLTVVQLLRKDQRRSRAEQSKPQHLEFVMRKTNVDSGHAISELSRLAKCPRKAFNVAGVGTCFRK